MATCPCLTRPGYWQRADIRPLTLQETLRAERVAEARCRSSFNKRSKDSVNKKTWDDALKKDRLGAEAELAFCIFMGVPWRADVDTYDKYPDVEPDIEIRCRDGWRNIIIRDKDIRGPKGQRRFVAMNKEGDHYVIYGWIWGYEADVFPKQDFGGYNRPARFIPVEQLHRLPFYENHPKMHVEHGVDSKGAHNPESGGIWNRSSGRQPRSGGRTRSKTTGTAAGTADTPGLWKS